MDHCKDYKVFDDAIGFTKQVLRLNNVVLGIRWMTYKRVIEHTNPAIIYGYFKKNTDEMFELLKNTGVTKKKGQPINLFIRGQYANKSREHLLDLYEKLNKTNPVTFTLYTDEQYWFNDTLNNFTINFPVHPENIPALRDFIQFIGPDKVYLQVSNEIRADLDLRGLSNQRPAISSAPGIVQMEFISLIVFIALVGAEFVEIFVFQ